MEYLEFQEPLSLGRTYKAELKTIGVLKKRNDHVMTRVKKI